MWELGEVSNVISCRTVGGGKQCNKLSYSQSSPNPSLVSLLYEPIVRKTSFGVSDIPVHDCPKTELWVSVIPVYCSKDRVVEISVIPVQRPS